MEQISFYLKRFETLEIKGDKLKEKIIKIIKENLNINLKKEEINILKNGNIKISKIGSEKTVIFLNKEKIENILNKEII
jgi:hypothetical protein